ncbi:MAG TPA: UPF0280 family protein [Candidatus Lokiarchaeia archaeon]|nr:UPF0280 family protein [Candidatus Lokiarchaeia archaeon]
MKLNQRKYLVGESKGTICCDNITVIDKTIEVLRSARLELESFIDRFPEFKITFEPWTWEDKSNVPSVVQRMIDATLEFGVGPMAAVAGALVDEVYDRIAETEQFSSFVMEDGGEILVRASTAVTIGLYAGKADIGSRVGFVIQPGDVSISGIATSSATVSHAISFGNADIVTVFCKNATLADAASTAICNMTQSIDEEESIKEALEGSKQFPSVSGVFVVRGSKVGMTGKLPKIVKLTGHEKDLLDFVS